MTRRTDRVGNLIRNTLGEILLRRISDPRVNPAKTSITKVEVLEDFLSARVYISVIGTEPEQRRTLQALRHASGHIQELLAKEITLRNTPILNFILDTDFKKTLKTLELISYAMRELEEKEAKKDESQTPEAADSENSQ